MTKSELVSELTRRVASSEAHALDPQPVTLSRVLACLGRTFSGTWQMYFEGTYLIEGGREYIEFDQWRWLLRKDGRDAVADDQSAADLQTLIDLLPKPKH